MLALGNVKAKRLSIQTPSDIASTDQAEPFGPQAVNLNLGRLELRMPKAHDKSDATPVSSASPSAPSTNERHEFTCQIPNPGALTVAERIGSFAKVGTPIMRDAKCVIETSELRVLARDMYNTEVLLMKTPIDTIAQLTVRRVSSGQQAKDVFLQSIGAAFGIAAVILGIVLYKILTEPGMAPFDFGRFAGLSFIFFLVFGVGGAVVGAIRAATVSSIEKEKSEFQLCNSQKDCILAFRVEASRERDLSEVFRHLGWNNSASSK